MSTAFADLMSGYNNKVKAYNTAVTTAKPKLDNIQTRVSNLNPANLWDNPNTPDNEDQGALLRNELKSLESQYGDTFNTVGQAPAPQQTATSSTPDWSAYVKNNQDLYNDFNMNKGLHNQASLQDYGMMHWNKFGQNEGRELPGLNTYSQSGGGDSLNTAGYNDLVNQYNTILSSLDSSYALRQKQEQEARDKVAMLTGGLTQIGRNIPRLDINNLPGIIDAQETVYGIGDIWNEYARTNPVAGQLADMGAFNDAISSYDSILNSTKELETKRNSQIAQGKTVADSLYGFLDGLYPTLNAGDLSKYDEIKGYRDQLNTQYNTARRGWDNLDVDFDSSGIDSEVMAAMNAINSLISRGDQEKLRVSQAATGFQNSAYDILDRANSSGFYNLDMLTGLESAMSRLRGNAGSFQSPMGGDFSGIDQPLTEAQAKIQALKGQRTEALGGFSSGINELVASMDAIAPHDEAAMKALMTQFTTKGNSLTPFIGSDADAIRTQLTTGMNQVNDKLTQLSTARSELETRAKALEKSIKEAQFSKSSDLDSYFGDSKSIAEEVELYNAMQAMDEIDRITNLLNSSKQRIEGDEQAVQARNLAAQQRVTSRGTSRFAMLEPFTRTSNIRRGFNPDEESVLTGGISSFSNSLGLGA